MRKGKEDFHGGGHWLCAGLDRRAKRGEGTIQLICVVFAMGKLDVEECRKAAEGCRREAERALCPVDRERWLKMAAEWSQLARQAEEKRR
jgi:hypothetical protein